MYRALAVYFLDNGIKAENTEEVVRACEKAEVSIAYRDGVQQVMLKSEKT